MLTTTNINADIKQPGYAIVHAVQGDRLTRKIAVSLYDGGTAWTPPASGVAWAVRFGKPDGTQGYYDEDENGNAAVTVSGSVATVTLAQQAITCAGSVRMDLDCYTTTGTVAEHLSTFSWIVEVEAAPCDMDSTDYINVTDGAARRQCIANDYSASSTYAVGDFCLYNHLLYKCTTAITTAEAWTSGHWTVVKVMDVLSENYTPLSVIAGTYSTSSTYQIGERCIYNGKLYVCKTAITTAEAWTSGHWKQIKAADGLMPSGVIPTGTDLDDVVEKGIYSFNQNATCPNAPVASGNRFLFVLPDTDTDYLTQIFVEENTKSVWFRMKWGASAEFSDWWLMPRADMIAPLYDDGAITFSEYKYILRIADGKLYRATETGSAASWSEASSKFTEAIIGTDLATARTYLKAAMTDIVTLQGDVETLETDVSDLRDDVEAIVDNYTGMIAAKIYDSGALSVSAGEYVIRKADSKLYRALYNATMTAWDSSKFEEAVLGDDILVIAKNIAAPYSDTSTYAVGEYVIYGDRFYRCKEPITTAEVWTDAHWLNVTVADRLLVLDTEVSDLQTSVAGKVTAFSASVDASSSVAYLSRTWADKVHVYQTPLTILSVQSVTDHSAIWFTVGTNGTVTLPSGLTYMPGTPSFTPGKTYYLQFAQLTGSTVSTCFWGEFDSNTI